MSITGLEIAVIGMSGRFPGAEDIETFWSNLKNGIESISFFSVEELSEAGNNPQLTKNPDYVKAVGLLEDIEYFDSAFFGYTPTEAEMMDPQIRIFHECTWKALEDAGYASETYTGLIGLYAGASPNFNWEASTFLSRNNSNVSSYSALHLRDKDFLSLRISYKLNLSGPSFSIYTACSTSLVAIHLACQGLLNGECDIALAGGITATNLRKEGYIYQEGMILSPDGHCRAFDIKTKGVVPGNGAGIVVLKRFEEADADGDHIYAVIKGSAINNDGIRKPGFSAPGVEGQAEVIKTALHMAEAEPESISYVETHGTGTILGDPVEIEGLKLAYSTDKKGYCKIGSVKTNFGHLDSAAGVAGFIKTVLALKHKLVPPNLHFEKSNPKIDFANSPFYVNAELSEWTCNGYPRRAGVSSFGIGGTNAHVVLEEAPEIESLSKSRTHQLLLLSAKTRTALDRTTENLVKYLKQNPGINLADACYTLQVGRKAFENRKMTVCSDINEAIDALSSPDSGKVQTLISNEGNRPVVFMFSGQGSQYVNMGLDLYREEQVFREEMDRCIGIINSLVDYDIKEILYPGARSGPVGPRDTDSDRINQTEITQPVIFAFEYALAKLLMGWGIEPDAMVGHSIGEYVAACLSGVFRLEDAISLVVLRGKLMQQMPPGAMLSVSLSEEDLTPLLNEELSLAAVNSTSLCVVSGSHRTIDDFAEQLKKKGYKSRRLHTSHAFHSGMMEPVLKKLEEKVRTIQLNEPGIPYVSNLTGHWITAEEVVNPGYWPSHLRQTVKFSQGLKTLLNHDENFLLVEVGPGNSLSTFTRQYKDKKPGQMVINLIRHPKEDISDIDYLLTKIGQMWLYGVKIGWEGFYSEEKRYRIPLPTYSFDGQRCWIDVDPFRVGVEMLNKDALTRKKTDISEYFYLPSWKQSILAAPGLKDIGRNAGSNSWLIFLDECGLGALLVKKLRKEKHEVITVAVGPGFRKVSDEEYIINPALTNDYHRLFNELTRGKRKVGWAIVHLWNVTGKGVQTSEFAKVQDLGFYSQIYLVQAMEKQNVNGEIRITMISNNMQKVTGEELLAPEKATLLGPVKVIPQEYPHVVCRSIDVDLPGSGSWQQDKLIDQLKAEIPVQTSETVIAYRHNQRWVQTFEAFRLEGTGSLLPLKQGGVYLITGGLGGIGLVLAEYLAETVGARLVLTGRTVLPERKVWDEWLPRHKENEDICRKIRKVLDIEKKGSEIMVLHADAANQQQMQEVINQAEKRFGPINGVIHAAGDTRGKSISSAIQDISPAEGEQQFQAKVQGLLVLEKVLEQKKLDFCLLMSSLSSVLGGLGFAVYSAANLFMDAFAQKHGQTKTSPWISVDWDGWQLDEEQTQNSAVPEVAEPLEITPEEGKKIFQRVLSWGEKNQVVVSTRDLQTRIDQWVKLESIRGEETSPKEKKSSLHARPNLPTPFVAPRNPLEQSIANIWQEFFGFDQVGIYDDFFELGGDSLKVMSISAKIHKKLDVNIPLGEFFTRTNIKEFARYIAHAEKDVHSPIMPVEKKEFYPLSSAQKRLYILQQLEKDKTIYNQSKVVLLEGNLYVKRLEQAFKKMSQRHESLRTSIIIPGEEPMQKIHDPGKVKLALQYHEAGEEEAKEWVMSFIKPFNLGKAPFLRVGIIKIGENKHTLAIDMHHIITDAVSHNIFVTELLRFYEGKELPLLHIQYKDYSEWQIRNGKIKKQEEYWLKKFEGRIPVLNLPTDYNRHAVQTFEGSTLDFEIGMEETIWIKEIAKKQGVTVFMFFLAIYNILLSKISGQDEIIVGTVINGRKHTDLDHIIGMFVNTLALRNYPNGDQTFIEFLNEVREVTLGVFENSDYPFENLVDKIVTKRDISRNPLFDALFEFQNIEIAEVKIPGLQLKPFEYKKMITMFDLNFSGTEVKGSVFFTIEYSTKLFKKETMEKFVDYFKEIVLGVVKNPQKKLSEIEIMHQEDKGKLMKKVHDEKLKSFIKENIEINRELSADNEAEFDF